MIIVNAVRKFNNFLLLIILIFWISVLNGWAQDNLHGYAQASFQKTLQIISPKKSVNYSFWVDQTDSFSITVSSVIKNLEIKLINPQGLEFPFGLSGSDSLQSYLDPDPLLFPNMPGANYVMDLNNPTVGQWALLILAPSNSPPIVIVPIRIDFNNHVGITIFTGSENAMVGQPIPVCMAVVDGSALIRNLQSTSFLYRLDDSSISPVLMTFLDDGTAADFAAADAIYSSLVLPRQAGEYLLKVEVAGDASTGHFQRSTGTRIKVVPKQAAITGKFKVKSRIKLP